LVFLLHEPHRILGEVFVFSCLVDSFMVSLLFIILVLITENYGYKFAIAFEKGLCGLEKVDDGSVSRCRGCMDTGQYCGFAGYISRRTIMCRSKWTCGSMCSIFDLGLQENKYL